MSYEGLKKRLIFHLEGGEFIGKFLIDIIPRAGEIWDIPMGSHHYNREQGAMTVEVLKVMITPWPWHIDVHIKCRETKHLLNTFPERSES